MRAVVDEDADIDAVRLQRRTRRHRPAVVIRHGDLDGGPIVLLRYDFYLIGIAAQDDPRIRQRRLVNIVAGVGADHDRRWYALLRWMRAMQAGVFAKISYFTGSK